MSSEEQACLVRTRSDSENSGRNIAASRGMSYADVSNGGGGAGSGGGSAGSEGAPSSRAEAAGDAGHFINPNTTEIMSLFHSDAIRQAGFGRHQLLMGAVCGLALAAYGVEYSVIPYVLPSAHVEYCITARQKWWLGSITLLGIAFGGVVWGCLADRMGRRPLLMFCLGLNAVFSVIAAFMPTYGPFMMCRFCSAVGIGGAPIAAISLLCEMVWSGGLGWRITCLVPGLAALGALAAAGAACLLLPITGPDTIKESRQHFSAWHRYLLLCTLPTLSALAGTFFWAHESPRYLLECGREVEALGIYQRIYKSNRSGAAGVSGSGAGYQLSELELPNKRSPYRPAPPLATSVRADMLYSLNQVCVSFCRLFAVPLSRTTASLLTALSCALFFQFAVLVYAPGLLINNKNEVYQWSTVRLTNKTYEAVLFNTSIENTVYESSSFTNCTFRDLTFSHVVFRSCNFTDVEFSGIMSSFTFFARSRFQNTRFIDTDLNTARHMDSECQLINSTILGLSSGCPLEADHNIYLREVQRVLAATAGAGAAAAIVAVILMPYRVYSMTWAMACALMSSFAIPSLHSELSITIFSCVFIFFVSLAYFGLTINVVESYPVHLRCTAHGFLFAVAHLAAFIATSIYANISLIGDLGATTILVLIGVVGFIGTIRVQDNTANFM